MRQLFPTVAEQSEAAAIYDDLTFPVRSDRPYVFANMVASVDGKAQLRGSAAGLGSPVDGALLGHLRALADGILEGAGTVRVDRVYSAPSPALSAARQAKSMAAQPRWVVLSGSGQVPGGDAVFRRPEQPTLLLTANPTAGQQVAAAGGQAEILPLPAGEHPLVSAFGALRQQYGIRWLLTEGGPTLLHTLFGEGLLDELFLTLAPKVVGGEVKTIVFGPPLGEFAAALELVSLYEHQSELYLRYRVGGTSPSQPRSA